MKRVNLCLNDTMGMINTLRITSNQHSKYTEKFNNNKEGKNRDRR